MTPVTAARPSGFTPRCQASARSRDRVPYVVTPVTARPARQWLKAPPEQKNASKKVAVQKKAVILHRFRTGNCRGLPCSVMVTQRFLVPHFLVRVRARQPQEREMNIEFISLFFVTARTSSLHSHHKRRTRMPSKNSDHSVVQKKNADALRKLRPFSCFKKGTRMPKNKVVSVVHRCSSCLIKRTRMPFVKLA